MSNQNICSWAQNFFKFANVMVFPPTALTTSTTFSNIPLDYPSLSNYTNTFRRGNLEYPRSKTSYAASIRSEVVCVPFKILGRGAIIAEFHFRPSRFEPVDNKTMPPSPFSLDILVQIKQTPGAFPSHIFRKGEGGPGVHFI